VSTEETGSCFQNVDLDLTFDGDITELIRGFGNALTEMHRREGFASFELRDTQPRDSDEAIAEYCRLVRALPRRARAVWNDCRRAMNVGLQAPAGHSVEFAVSQESVERLHEIGAGLVFTVYRRVE
jgi:hypothetical protein